MGLAVRGTEQCRVLYYGADVINSAKPMNGKEACSSVNMTLGLI